MSSKKPAIMIRTTDEIIKKFKIICESEHRSLSNYAEKLVIDTIKNYESEHGEIEIKKD